MAKFIIFVIDTPGARASSEEMVKIDIFNEKLQTNGNWILAAGITGSAHAYLVDGRGENLEAAAGSLVESAENYTGFWIIEAASESQAIELAQEGSYACNRRVELRPFLR